MVQTGWGCFVMCVQECNGWS